jgi:hypothetical protein
MLYQNVNGIRSKLTLTKERFPTSPYELITLCETNLGPDISDNELGLCNYNVYRRDRDEDSSIKSSGGGVLLGVHKDWKSWSVPISITSIECLFVAVRFSRSCFLVGVVYLPPGSPPEKYSDFCDAAEEALASQPSHAEIILAGDFNLPNTDWCSMEMSNNFDIRSKYISDLATAMGLKQCNMISNQRGVVLDLVLTSIQGAYVQPALDAVLKEDIHHPALEICFLTEQPKISEHGKWSLDLNKCNLEAVFSWIQNTQYPVYEDDEDVEDAFVTFCNGLEKVITSNSPLKYIGTANFPRWYSAELKHLIVKKKIFHKTFKLTHTHEDYLRFSGIRRRCNVLAKQCYETYIDNLNSAIPNNIRVFWGHVNSQRKRSSFPPRMHLDGIIADDPSEICDLFSKFFASVYQLPKSHPGTYTLQSNVNLTSCFVTCTEMEKKLMALDPFKGSGPDSLTPKVIKYCACVLSPHLTLFFNLLMKKGIFPRNLKTGFIAPIHKSGDPENIRNYRAVVIQSCLAKVFESLVLDVVKFNFSSLIIPQQHGFHAGRSTSTNLTIFQHHIMQSFAKNSQVDAIYIDFAKAFDRISHIHLISKLEALGIQGCLLQWFRSYLADRWLFVRFRGEISDGIPALSGVPQGSLMGPTLFSLFINDIGCSLSTEFLLFADDAKIFTEINGPCDYHRLQDSMNYLVDWCVANAMDLNSSKCFVITYSRSHTPQHYVYEIGGSPLDRVERVKDLGVIMVPSLNPLEHILHITKKANASLGLVMRASRDGFSVQSLRHLYISLVRPHLEYASVVWSPYQRNHCEIIEKIQRRFLKLIGVRLGFNYLNVPVADLQHELSLSSLETRRNKLDLIFLFKLVNNEIDSPHLLELVDLRIPSRNTRSNELFSRRPANTWYGYHSSVPRLLRLGNAVSSQVCFFSTSLVVFRRQLENLINQVL